MVIGLKKELMFGGEAIGLLEDEPVDAERELLELMRLHLLGLR